LFSSAFAATDMAISPDGQFYNRPVKLHAHILHNRVAKLHTIWSCPGDAIPLR
jgi:hypothetical protein